MPVVASLIITGESFTKGWLTLWAVPSLVVTIPLLFVVHAKARSISARTGAPRVISIVRNAQLVSATLAYVLLPGIGDGYEVLMFGFLVIDGRTRVVEILGHVRLAAGAAMILSTVTFFIVAAWLKRRPFEETDEAEIVPRGHA